MGSQKNIILVALVAILAIVVIEAQQTEPQACQSVTGMAGLNASRFINETTWFEQVRGPAVAAACIQVYSEIVNNYTQILLRTSHSSSNTSTYMNVQQTATVNVTDINQNTGFQVSYNPANGSPATYKIIDTDYSSYIVVCGYTSTNESSSFGAIFNNLADANATFIQELVNKTSATLSNFNITNTQQVLQKGCYASSGSINVPILTSIVAAFYFVVKFIN